MEEKITMIWIGLFMIIHLLLTMLLGLFSLFSFTIPVDFQNNLVLFVSKINYFGGVVPVDTLLQVSGILVTFFTLYYTIAIIRWVWAHVPWLGHKEKNPTVSSRPGRN